MQAEEIIKIDPILKFCESWCDPPTRCQAIGVMLKTVGQNLCWALINSSDFQPHQTFSEPTLDREAQDPTTCGA